jgi:hypothetical protein
MRVARAEAGAGFVAAWGQGRGQVPGNQILHYAGPEIGMVDVKLVFWKFEK